ncbi:MAG TPA: hypothetical protein VGL58_00940 [Caulobacteraceae bacterium]|jgi:hypothetical protein
MTIEKLATVLPVDDVAAAVAAWSQALGATPTFVDGERWAQFDVAGGRLCLAGADRASDRPGLMLKVADLDAARAALAAFSPGAVAQGPHERRFSVDLPGGAATFYAPG